MPLNYNPEDATTCWPEGDYAAVLTSVEDKTSKVKADGSGGNPMQVWTFDVYHSDGRTQPITEYVVIPAATFKIKQFARALDKEAEFKAGKFQADNYIGSTVLAELSIESQQGYDDKNRIAKLKAKAQPAANGATPRQWPARPRPVTVTQEQAISADQQFKEEDVPF